ncbi:MAG: SDR family oxidoreductase [Cellulomonadaceae bacterium]
MPTDPPLVLVAGATGYVGGRLVPRLLAHGYDVRVIVRRPQRLDGVPWRDQVEIVQGDLSEPDDVDAAFGGVHTLFYLVHSMASGSDFEQTEQDMARAVARAAERGGVGRVVYLGGLHPHDAELSTHMRSRTAVGRVFLDSSVPASVFQAGVVIGSGSASFEMIRHLSENLPVMPAPRWVRRHIEPIAIRDLLHYLVRAPELPEGTNRTFDLGSGEVFTYAELMHGYAHAAGIARRTIYSLPTPAPRLAGWWVALVTPIPHAMAVPLVESLQHDAVTSEHDIDDLLGPPPDGPTGYLQAVRLALGRIEEGTVETSWSGASARPFQPAPTDPAWAGRVVYRDERSRRSSAPPERVWAVVEGIGGANGWYSLPAAWAVRGVADTLVGGVGLRRGRRDPARLVVGDALDWWRVDHVDPGRAVRLRAEMRLPGAAWLELKVEPDGTGSVYHQRASYVPRGLLGKLYWWGIWPFHGLIFPSMARNILARAEAREREAIAGA